jgi:hypothetical protein
MMACQNQRRHKNWCGRFGAMAGSIGLEYLMDTEEVFNRNKTSMIRDINKKVFDQVNGNWHEQLAKEEANHGRGRNKLRLYRRYKCLLAPEPYLTSCVKQIHRKALAKFRCGVAPLAIETGRYRQVPLMNRKCFNCSDNVEDELHVLMVCPVYDDLRLDLCKNAVKLVPGFGVLSDYCKVDTILGDARLIKVSANFCYNILEMRKTLLSA